jgi:hypothetical protein
MYSYTDVRIEMDSLLSIVAALPLKPFNKFESATFESARALRHSQADSRDRKKKQLKALMLSNQNFTS